MDAEAKKIKDFSIWNSVVNDKIIQFEELEKKYDSRGHQIEILTDENGLLKDQNNILHSKMDTLNEELCEKQNRIDQLQKDNYDLKKHIENMENSTSWKITKPIRRIFDSIRK